MRECPTIETERLKMSGKICLSVIVLSIVTLLSACISPPDIARVIKVVDGDTIIIEGNYQVRYIGMDTPEIQPNVEPFAMEAWEANRRLVAGKEVRLERDVSQTDKYGRLLRYVYVDDVFVNAELVRQGLAEAKAYPPDTKHHDYLEQVEAEAREAGRGMWGK